MTRVLLPTDFSANAYNAIVYALNLFKDVECVFYLLHTYTPPIYQTEYLIGNPGQIGLGDVLQEASQTRLEKLKKKLESTFDNPGHRFMVHTAFNTLMNEVLETNANENIDYVVMGTKGASGAKEILLGSNTVHIIRKSQKPVIAVPENFVYENPVEILFPTDYEVSYSKEKLKPLLLVAGHYKSRINIMHVSSGYELTPMQKEQKKRLGRILGKGVLFHDMPEDDLIQAINSFQDRSGVNLLAMVQNKHTFFERLFVEPVIRKIGLHIKVPFMVLPHM